jgi:hypothetical protein
MLTTVLYGERAVQPAIWHRSVSPSSFSPCLELTNTSKRNKEPRNHVHMPMEMVRYWARLSLQLYRRRGRDTTS